MPRFLDVDVAREARNRKQPADWAGRNKLVAEYFADNADLKGTVAPRVEGTNSLTGTVRRVVFSQPAGFGMADDGSPAGRISQALLIANQLDQSLGFDGSRTSKSQFFADPMVQSTTDGSQVVYLNQHHLGIPVFKMSRTVRFSEKASKVEFIGDHAPDLDLNLNIRPTLAVADAVFAAVKYVSDHQSEDDPSPEQPDEYKGVTPAATIDLKNFKPVLLASFNLPSQPSLFESKVLGAQIPANLVFYLVDVGVARLAWDVIVTLPNGERQYRVILPADELGGEVLYAKKVSGSATRPSGNIPKATVFATDPAIDAATNKVATAGSGLPTGPASASAAAAVSGLVYYPSPANGAPKTTAFPMPVSDYPLGVSTPPSGLGLAWVKGGQDFADGPNAIAVKGFANLSNPTGDPTKLLRGVRSGGKLSFNSASPTGDEQKLANIFFFCNYMHDFFYLLGFDVASGNFEGDDGVIAQAHPGTVSGTANMLTHPDHQRPVMNMGLVAGNVNRHTAFDADVVFHEYTHGVSNRLVGGPMNAAALEAEQSGSMGEGWSDYFALTIQNFSLPASAERTTTGDWVVNQPGVGIRNAPYTDRYPHDYGDIRTNSDLQEVHNAGEIWCACLMHMNRKLTEALGDRERAYREAWQIVVDSFKVCPANPSFLDARDAILTALEGRQTSGALSSTEYQSCRKAVWTAFAGFGMGAQAPNNGSDFTSAVSDNHLPQDLGGTKINRPKDPPGFEHSQPTSQTFAAAGGAAGDDYNKLLELWSKLSEKEQWRLFGKLEEVYKNSYSTP